MLSLWVLPQPYRGCGRVAISGGWRQHATGLRRILSLQGSIVLVARQKFGTVFS